MNKLRCAIIGPGNIGMNLFYKLQRSEWLEVSLFVGRDENSKNIKTVKSLGYKVATESYKSLFEMKDEYDIIFDATSAVSHLQYYEELKKLNKFIVDLTPSRKGQICIPCLNEAESVSATDVNMVTCGGQSLVPLAYAISKVCSEVKYFEAVSTISSKSAGMATRDNIDEYISSTEQALRKFTGVDNVKAMIILNPAEPPILMRNTLYARVGNVDLESVKKSICEYEEVVKRYVKGFSIIVLPFMLRNDIIALSVQVEGTGDFLPKYAGNLDIITCAGIEIAEKYAMNSLKKG